MHSECFCMVPPPPPPQPISSGTVQVNAYPLVAGPHVIEVIASPFVVKFTSLSHWCGLGRQ